MKKVLAINSGSSSFKYKLFALPEEQVLAEGIADRVGIEGSSFEIKLPNGEKHTDEVSIPDQESAVNLLLAALKKYQVVTDLDEIVGVGHRIVAGGEDFPDSAIIDQEKLQKIYDLKEYAPLHNVAEGKGIEAFMKLLPNVPEVGVFDTSFHQTLDSVHYMYSLPYKYYEKYGVRKYGAHGTSVRYIVGRAAEMLNKDRVDLKLIVCHLGSGASVTAVKNGKSYDTSMGFTPLAGVTMGTRSGDVDASVLQYIMNKENLDINQMIDILNDKSGLLGISEISSDMRDLENDSDDKAKLARDIFVNRVRQYVGSYITEMEGVDAIIFTAGVGEHDAGVREKVMQSFEFMGLDPDYEANKSNGEKFISKPDSKIKALIIPTDEELMIERDVVRLAHLN
ncbi:MULTISPECIES: acetate/propionate family kinase [unclassified Lactobacillus]|uniref:acetate/propionate family kinase n=1 Tax=unclassified Lactobacillus TaxID=2620435 RepID=UPI000EFCE126|nr:MULTISPECIES: acetate kinase [unclassified Lactobacillus]RMC46237.1 acetate kinase [Lactobacillus sp. ESL0230]RMC51290.1 acetate kinase [Lactobacillus sp. ESL0225]